MFTQNFISIEDLARNNTFAAQSNLDMVYRTECAEDALLGHCNVNSLDAYLFILIDEGYARMNINCCDQLLGKGTLLLLKPYVPISIFTPSVNYHSSLLLIDKYYMEHTAESNRFHGLLNRFIAMHRVSVIVLDDTQRDSIACSWNCLVRITSTMNVYKEDAIKYFLNIVLAELSDILYSKTNNDSAPIIHKDKLFQQFLQLLTANFSTRHSISFYAKELGISSVYLSRIVKEISGKTVHDYISERLYIAAKHLLTSTDFTISEIADKLNFSDQSAFGKFFKAYEHISPLKYRKLIK